MMCCMVSSVLFERVWSCFSLFLMMSRAGSTGTEVKILRHHRMLCISLDAV